MCLVPSKCFTTSQIPAWMSPYEELEEGRSVQTSCGIYPAGHRPGCVGLGKAWQQPQSFSLIVFLEWGQRAQPLQNAKSWVWAEGGKKTQSFQPQNPDFYLLPTSLTRFISKCTLSQREPHVPEHPNILPWGFLPCCSNSSYS